MFENILYLYTIEITNKTIEIMTRLQTLENRLARLQAKKEDYTLSERIGGKIYRNPKAARFAFTCTLIQREIRNIEKETNFQNN